MLPEGKKNEPHRQMYWYTLLKVSGVVKSRRVKFKRAPICNQSYGLVVMASEALYLFSLSGRIFIVPSL